MPRHAGAESLHGTSDEPAASAADLNRPLQRPAATVTMSQRSFTGLDAELPVMRHPPMWSPIPFNELRDLIRQSEAEMAPTERRLWELVRIPPEKWTLSPWGNEGGGFWAVGLLDGHVIWYNDIEDGFNISRHTERGTIGDYWCNQGSLQPILWGLLHQIETGEAPGAFGPPRPPSKPA